LILAEDNGLGGELFQLLAKLDQIGSDSAERFFPLTVEGGKGGLSACILQRFRNIHRALGAIFARWAVGRRAALTFEEFLRALDRVAFIIEKASDASKEVDILGTVVAPAATALEGTHLRKLAFPKAEDMLGDVEIVGDLAYRSKRASGFRTA
jgi:hypothetical protein